jgi:hypothetical protein
MGTTITSGGVQNLPTQSAKLPEGPRHSSAWDIDLWEAWRRLVQQVDLGQESFEMLRTDDAIIGRPDQFRSFVAPLIQAPLALMMVVFPEGTPVSGDRPLTLRRSTVAGVEVGRVGYVISLDLVDETSTEFLSALQQGFGRSAEALSGAYQHLDEFLALTAGWDSYGALPVAQTAIATAKKVLASIQASTAGLLGEETAPSAIVPVATGGVELEWTGQHGMLELFVRPEGTLGYLLELRQGAGKPLEEEGVVTSDQVSRLLARVP